jgi:lipopolysaccharide export system protein LptA
MTRFVHRFYSSARKVISLDLKSPQPPFFKGGLLHFYFFKGGLLRFLFQSGETQSPLLQKGSSFTPFEKGGWGDLRSESPPLKKGGWGGLVKERKEPPFEKEGLGGFQIGRLLSLFLLGFMLAQPTAWALHSDAQQPLSIEANDVEVREVDGTSVYVGQVLVTQGTLRLTADHVTVYHQENRQPRFIIALGKPVHYQQQLDGSQGAVQASAQRMEYDAVKDELILLGDGLLVQGTDRLASERIIYDRARAQFRAGGSGRVKITITPDQPPAPAARQHR